MRGLVVVALLAGACSFTPGKLTSDADVDSSFSTTVGFAKTTTLADEDSGTVSIRVALSAPAESAVTVAYTISGGTATTDDYTASNGTLTFAPGDVEESIDVTIKPDGLEESDETIELSLGTVTGPASLGDAMHTITISANVLPRVNFMAATTSGAEATSPSIMVTLSSAPAVTTSVQVKLNAGTTATGGGTDFTFTPATITFAPGETVKTVTLTINNDALDEFDEVTVLELDTPVGTVLGTTTTTTHTIQDDDDPPTIAFAAATSSIDEAQAMIDLTVSLSGPSGKDITAAFAVDVASSATGSGTDYNLATTSPLMFPAGMTTKTIRVTPVQDTAVEGPETVVINLGTLSNAMPAAPQAHTLTITDDDSTCYGTGSYLICVAPQAMDTTIMGTGLSALNTDTSPLCASAAPAGWTGPSSCFIIRRNVTFNATDVTGTRPLVVLATQSMTVAGNIDAASHIGAGAKTGPGFGSSMCGTPGGTIGSSNNGGGGGAGGSFMTKGGDGGTGNGGTSGAGTAPAALVSAPTVLRGGCNGQNGGNGNGANGGIGGPGGGAIYLVTGGALTINTGIWINASGAGGRALTAPNNGDAAGGGGGGSGGMIRLHAATLSANGAHLIANGGGGMAAGDSNDPGTSGNDPDPTNPLAPALGGTTGVGGTNGGDGSVNAGSGGSSLGGTGGNGGGGGGGGAGLIQSNIAPTGAIVSPPAS